GAVPSILHGSTSVVQMNSSVAACNSRGDDNDERSLFNTSIIHGKHVNLSEILSASRAAECSTLQGTVESLPKSSVIDQVSGSTVRDERKVSFVDQSGDITLSAPPTRNVSGCNPRRVLPQQRQEDIVTGPSDYSRELRQRARTCFDVEDVPFVESPDESDSK
ncbi:uncharacterized protein TM35_000262290, partial [Trypanosoma theileri]